MRTLTLSLLLLAVTVTTASAAPLSVADAIALARQNNPTLKSAGHATAIAADARDAAFSGYLPRIDVEGGYTVLKDPQAFVIGGGVQPTQDDNYPHASLAAVQPLYDFGRTAGRVGQADALQTNAREQYRALEQEVLLQTVAAYYRILSAERQLQAADMEVTQMQEHLRRAEALFEQGLVTRNDVLQAEVRLAGSRQQQLGRANALDNNWLLFNHLTGQAADARSELEHDETLAELPPEPQPDAFAGRGDLLAQQALVQSRQEELRLSSSAFYPELFVRAGVDYVENSYVKEQTMFSLTAGLRMNLFDGMASSARKQQAIKGVAQSRDRLQELQGEAAVEYRTALNDARVAAAQIEVTREAIRQGEENLRLNQNRYQEQVGSATEVLDAQTLLTRTRTDNARALYDYQVAVARVKKSTGTLGQE